MIESMSIAAARMTLLIEYKNGICPAPYYVESFSPGTIVSEYKSDISDIKTAGVVISVDPVELKITVLWSDDYNVV